ncbi:MAG: Rieske 2Fe-2S domain-containing protein [Thermoleophilia bacterium]
MSEPAGRQGSEQDPHVPPPSLWPVGFAVGIATLLVGLIVNPKLIAPIGAAITVIFAFLWVRDVMRERSSAVQVEPAAEPALSEPEDELEAERFPRSRFLEGATLGLGAAIGGLVTVPALGFAVAPAFLHQQTHNVDLGPISDFTEGEYVVATFMVDPAAGEVSRRTAYVRNNGLLKNLPSFTILSNRCAHLGCPVQPNGPVFQDKEKIQKTDKGLEVRLIPTLPAGGFGCPCHGGQYDTEGNRVAGPPVRALDRYEYSIRNGNLWLGKTYSVGKVKGQGANAQIDKYPLAGPGEHVDGLEKWLYPVDPPHG